MTDIEGLSPGVVGIPVRDHDFPRDVVHHHREGTGRAHWVLFRVDLFPWDGYNVGAFYAGQDINGGTDLFSLDSLIGVAMRGRIWGPISLFAEFTRRWRRVDDEMGLANETGGGIGFSMTY